MQTYRGQLELHFCVDVEYRQLDDKRATKCALMAFSQMSTRGSCVHIINDHIPSTFDPTKTSASKNPRY